MFERILAKCRNYGRLTYVDHKGRRHEFHNDSGPAVTIRATDWVTDLKLAVNPWVAVGEAYMDGRLVVDEGSLFDFVEVGMRNSNDIDTTAWVKAVNIARMGMRWWHQYNPIGLARRNVAHHYDLSRRLFELFLDPTMQYSCAYFPSPQTSLAEAQQAKMRHIAAKLLLEPGMRVFDIGSGWGGLALHLAKYHDVEVVGVTLSSEQFELATQRVKSAGLEKKVTFKLQDYRLETGAFDRIVSVGMFEHVGVRHYPEFFEKARDLLRPNGVALLHSIGRREGPGTSNPWLRKYIFPGSYSPALSEVVPVVERTGLWISDVEILGLHYAETLRHWRANFNANRAEITRLYDERFCRMWEFYLAGCEMSFRLGFSMVFQMQLCKQIDAVPMTRDYMFDREREAGAARAANDKSKSRKDRAA